MNCWRHSEFNFRSPTLVTNISRDNKDLTSDPARQRARRQMFLNFVFVFVYTVIRGRAVRTSLDKKLDILWRNYFFMRNRVYAYLCIDVMN